MATNTRIDFADSFLTGLTKAEKLIVEFYGEGATIAEIATALGLPEHQVLKMHLSMVARLESHLQNLTIAAN